MPAAGVTTTPAEWELGVQKDRKSALRRPWPPSPLVITFLLRGPGQTSVLRVMEPHPRLGLRCATGLRKACLAAPPPGAVLPPNNWTSTVASLAQSTVHRLADPEPDYDASMGSLMMDRSPGPWITLYCHPHVPTNQYGNLVPANMVSLSLRNLFLPRCSWLSIRIGGAVRCPVQAGSPVTAPTTP